MSFRSQVALSRLVDGRGSSTVAHEHHLGRTNIPLRNFVMPTGWTKAGALKVVGATGEVPCCQSHAHVIYIGGVCVGDKTLDIANFGQIT